MFKKLNTKCKIKKDPNQTSRDKSNNVGLKDMLNCISNISDIMMEMIHELEGVAIKTT